jgi:hypothetical protein
MENFYPNPLSLRGNKRLILSVFFLGILFASSAQQYTARLSGPAEAPPNTSPGTGTASVTITGTSMRLQASFSGLIGNTTVSHIHAPTTAAGTGAAGVATTTPTFAGFPAGVTSGTYDRTLDMLAASSYNPTYITANGGTPASAFAALKAAMDAGKSYWNIHSSAFPGGEIRGFLVICPTITVSVPDAYALPQGTQANTVYPAYAPASSLTLSASASGGTGPYGYSWSNGALTSTTMLSPAVNTTYTVTVKDQNGCLGTATKAVNVMDIAGGRNGDKIVICHKGSNTLTIGTSGVTDHLGHGDMLGGCDDQARSITRRNSVTDEFTTTTLARTLANPSWNHFDIRINGKAGIPVQVRVFDLLGRIVETRTAIQSNQTLRIGNLYNPGRYIVEIMQGRERQTLTLIKER